MELLMRRQQVRMSKVQKLRAVVNQRLSAVAQEICELFERTIDEYEDEILRPKQQILRPRQYKDDQHQQIQEPVLEPSAVSLKADVQIVSACQRAAILEQTNTELIYIKEEPEEDHQDTSSELHPNPCEEKMEETYEDISAPTDSSSDIDSSENWTLKWALQGDTSKLEGCNGYPIHIIHPNTDRAAQTTTLFSNSKCMYEAEGLESSEKITDSSENETKSKLHQCGQCGKAYQHRPSLHRHILIHKEQKPFTCSVCQKGFSQKPHLTSHMRIHTGEKPFSCPFCAKSFTNQSNVRQHLRVHTGEKPFICSVCNVQFGCTKSLQTHMRIHTGERPFGCPECGKRFKQQSSFIGHMRSHRGEKPFCCPVCDRRFSQRTNLKNHIKSHNVEVMAKVSDAAVEEESGQSKSASTGEQSEDYITVSI